MNRMIKNTLLVTALALVAGSAEAQVGTLSNGPVTVVLNATQAPTLTLTTSAASVTMPAIGANALTQFPGLTVTAAWNLTAGTTIRLVGWFATPASALTSGGNNIAAARVVGRTGAAAFAPFTSGVSSGLGVAGGTLQLWSVNATPLNSTASTNLDLGLDYVGQASPNAGTYTGTLNLRAIVQ